MRAAIRVDRLNKSFGRKQALFDLALSDEGQPLDLRRESRRVPRLQVQRELELFGRRWHLTVSSTPQYEQGLDNRSLSFSLWVGLLAAVLLALSTKLLTSKVNVLMRRRGMQC